MYSLEELYRNPAFGLLSKDKFYRKVKQILPEITKKEVDNFFDENITAQLHKPIPKSKNLPIVGLPNSYQMDLIFFLPFKRQNRGFDTALILVNINSRYAYGEPIKGKNQTSVNSAFKRILDKSNNEEKQIKIIESDNGSEFLSKSFQKILKDNDIQHRTAQVGDHNFLGKIDRFSRTIKQLINKYMTTYRTTKWVDVFDKLIDNYNHTLNRAINIEPANVNQSMEAEINNEARDKYKEIMKQIRNIQVGDFVRIPNSKLKFEKEGQTYSNKIYQIVDINGSKAKIKNSKNDELKTKYNIQKLLKVKQQDDYENDLIPEARRENRINRRIRKEGVEPLNVRQRNIRDSARQAERNINLFNFMRL